MTPDDKRRFQSTVFLVVFFGAAVGVGLATESGPAGVGGGLAAGLAWALVSGRLLGIEDEEPAEDPPPDESEPPGRPPPDPRPGAESRLRPPRARGRRRRP